MHNIYKVGGHCFKVSGSILCSVLERMAGFAPFEVAEGDDNVPEFFFMEGKSGNIPAFCERQYVFAHEGVEGIRYSYEEALSVFHNRTASSSGFLYFMPQSHSGDFTLKPLVYNDILIFLRQQNSPALCKYIDEYFNDIITKKIHIRQTWSVAAAFLTVLDGFITECSQRETLFPLLENALNTYQNCQSALQLKQLLQSTCKAVLDSLADEKNPRKSALVSQVQEYICLNFNHPDLRLETIASHFFVNPQHLSAVFSQESGVTLTSYINVCRMKKARQFLLEDSPSIQNVASLCGFSDSGYFSKCFRKYYGISPKNFVSLTEKNSYPGSIGI